MGNKLNRYYIKIETVMQRAARIIHQELWNPVLHPMQQLQDGQNVFMKKEKMSMIILDLLVHYPNLQAKIFNYFDKLSAMIHIQLIMKLYLRLLSLSEYNRTNYPRLAQDEKSSIWLGGTPSTNSQTTS